MSRYHPAYEDQVMELYKSEPRKHRPRFRTYSTIRTVITVLLTTGIILFGLWYYLPNLPISKEVPKAMEVMERDLGAVKKILAGVVPAVKELATRGNIKRNDSEDSPRLALVTVARAHIRRAPSIDAESILTIPSGTALIIKDVQNDWASTLTPLGEPGWVHTSVISME